jgi:hypothetical protein
MNPPTHAGFPSLRFLAFLTARELVRTGATCTSVRHEIASRSNELWASLASRRWGLRLQQRRPSDQIEAPDHWLRRYRELHAISRMPTGLYSGIADTILAGPHWAGGVCVWICAARGDTRLPQGLVRPTSTKGPCAVAQAVRIAPTGCARRSSDSPDVSAPHRASRGSSHASGADFPTLDPDATDSVDSRADVVSGQYLLLKFVIQNVESAEGVFVSGADIGLIFAGGDAAHAGVPFGHDAVVAVSGVAPEVHADAVEICPGGFAVLRLAFFPPDARRGVADGHLSEPEVLERTETVTLRLRSKTGSELAPLHLKFLSPWCHYRAVGNGLVVRLDSVGNPI